MNVCKFEGCDKVLVKKDFCTYHYKITNLASKFPEKKCLVQGCCLFKFKGDFCKSHALALRIYGDANDKRIKSATCTIDSCGQTGVSGGLCVKHYARFARNGNPKVSKNPNWGKCQASNKESGYKNWDAMMNRCYNEKHPHYKRYGGSGIFVAPEWWDFQNFRVDMGNRPEKMTIERIDGAKGYSKENCKWATFAEQARNRKDNKCTKDIVEMIRILKKLGMKLSKIHECFPQLSRQYIYELCTYKCWKGITI